MSESTPAPFGDVSGATPLHRLDSWKAIAEYLGRHVTTVQRWEQDEGLPVHRHHHEKRGSVYAYPAELNEWLARRSAAAPLVDAAGVFIPSASQRLTQPVPETGRPSTRLAALGIAALFLVVGGFSSLWVARGASERTTAVAVLPLTNRSPDQQPDYFVDGMTEALVTDLASLSALRVIARQSVMQYRNSGKPASTIATELGADALIEGAVQRSGSRVRVDIRLIDGRTSGALWATTYERDIGDALALQTEISRAVASELLFTLDPSQRDRLVSHRPSNPEAWDAYLRARFLWNKRTHEDMSRAIAWYERAIELDPTSAVVYAGLADVYASLGPPKMPIAELIARGTKAAERAIELDPRMGEPLAALGKLRAYAWDWQGAESNYRKAIERSPGYAPARYWFGAFLANQGRCSEALAEARLANRLDPVSLPGNMVISLIELRCNRIDETIKRTQMILEFDPEFGQAYEFLGRAYLLQRNLEAIPVLERGLELTGGRPTIRATLACAYAANGRVREAQAIARELAAQHERGKVLASAWSVAIAYAGLGSNEQALAWLEHSYADREEWLEGLAMDERFRGLRGGIGYQRLINRMGLPDAPPSMLTSQ
jgi:TolB-like protein/Tfp pilus assembly protein PilF